MSARQTPNDDDLVSVVDGEDLTIPAIADGELFLK
jgi:hypothetical protein